MNEIPPPPPPPPPVAGPPPSGWRPAAPGASAGWGQPVPGWSAAATLPGSGRFRAQAVGELLDSAFTLYRRNFLLLVAITAVVQVPLSLVSYLVYQLTGTVDATARIQQLNTDAARLTPDQQLHAIQNLAPTLVAFAAAVVGVALLQALLVQPIATAAMTRAVGDIYLDQPVTVGSAYRAVAQRVGAVLAVAGIRLLAGIAVLGGALALMVGALLLLGQAGIVLWVGIVPGAVILAVLVYARWLFAAPVVMLERAGAPTALRRSWRLVKGFTWRILGITLLVGLITGILSAIVGGLLTVLTQFGDANLRLVLQQLAQLIISVLIQPISFIVVVLLYYDLRIRREAFDIEMLAATL